MDGRSLLAWNLKRLRLERKIPQDQLAADSGVDRAYVSELEGKQGNATVDLLDKLAEASSRAISNIKFDKIVVWEGGGCEGVSERLDCHSA